MLIKFCWNEQKLNLLLGLRILETNFDVFIVSGELFVNKRQLSPYNFFESPL